MNHDERDANVISMHGYILIHISTIIRKIIIFMTMIYQIGTQLVNPRIRGYKYQTL